MWLFMCIFILSASLYCLIFKDPLSRCCGPHFKNRFYIKQMMLEIPKSKITQSKKVNHFFSLLLCGSNVPISGWHIALKCYNLKYLFFSVKSIPTLISLSLAFLFFFAVRFIPLTTCNFTNQPIDSKQCWREGLCGGYFWLSKTCWISSGVVFGRWDIIQQCRHLSVLTCVEGRGLYFNIQLGRNKGLI